MCTPSKEVTASTDLGSWIVLAPLWAVLLFVFPLNRQQWVAEPLCDWGTCFWVWIWGGRREHTHKKQCWSSVEAPPLHEWLSVARVVVFDKLKACLVGCH